MTDLTSRIEQAGPGEQRELHCDLGPMHGFASTYTDKDGVRCCDFCGHPVDAIIRAGESG